MSGSLRSWLAEHTSGRKPSPPADVRSADANGERFDHKPIEIIDLDRELDALGVGPDMVFDPEESWDYVLHQ